MPASPREHPHAISSFLFSPYVLRYGHLGVPHPNRQPGQFEENHEKYKVWNARILTMLVGISDLAPDQVEMHRLLELERERQNWTFGDVNSDGVVNILDLTLVAQYIGTLNPSNQRADVNKDGVVNILDLTLVAQHIG